MRQSQSMAGGARGTWMSIVSGVLWFIASSAAVAQADYYPIEGGGGGTVYCRTDQGLQLTGKRFGSSPSTVTGCIHARDAQFGLRTPSGKVVGCKGQQPVLFHRNGQLRQCTILYGREEFVAANGSKAICTEGSVAQFQDDGRLVACPGSNAPSAAARGATAQGDAVACDSLMKALQRKAAQARQGCSGWAEIVRPFALEGSSCVGAHKFWSKCEDNVARTVLEWGSRENPGRVAVSAVRQQYEREFPDLRWR